jgi:hypothetical protein
MEATLTVNKIEISLGHEALKLITDIIECHPDGQEVFHELAQHPSSDIRRTVAMNENIQEKTAKLLIKDSSINVLREIAVNRVALRIITEKDIQRLIETKDTRLLCEIANFIDEYQLCNSNLIAELLVNQPDPRVRCRLAENQYAPEMFLKQLSKDSDIDVAEAAKETLNDKRKQL